MIEEQFQFLFFHFCLSIKMIISRFAKQAKYFETMFFSFPKFILKTGEIAFEEKLVYVYVIGVQSGNNWIKNFRGLAKLDEVAEDIWMSPI